MVERGEKRRENKGAQVVHILVTTLRSMRCPVHRLRVLPRQGDLIWLQGLKKAEW